MAPPWLRNSMDLTEAEDIKKRWQEYTELYKKDFNDPDNHDGVITHLEPDILECEVKWALGRIPTNKLMEVMKFQIFKLVLGKAEEPEITLPTSTGSSKKEESSRKTSTNALLTMSKPLTVWITINCGKF